MTDVVGVVFVAWLCIISGVLIVIHGGHKHQWLPWSKQMWDGKPLQFTGAFGARATEVRICATCGEAQIRLVSIPVEHEALKEEHLGS